jgi:flagellar secretion chaperone FliS
MTAPNPYARYQDTKFSTTNKGALIVMLYDGAIRFLEEAKNRMKVKDFGGKGYYIDKAYGAINELRASLNFNADKKLADSLNQLYFFMTKQLSKATLDNDTKAVDIVIDLLKGLKEAWEQAVKKENPPAQRNAALMVG